MPNFLTIIWYLNFKHCFALNKRDFYCELDDEEASSQSRTIKVYYKNPIDMLLDKRTKTPINEYYK